jgi:HEAT repeat protein
MPLLRSSTLEDTRQKTTGWPLVKALKKIEPPAVPPLLQALTDKDQEVRDAGTAALTAIGLPAVSLLRNAVEEKTGNALYRTHAAIALLAINEPDARNARIAAASTLGELAPGAKEGMSALIAVFHDDDDRLRQGAARAVAKFGSLVLPELMRILQSEDPVMRKTAAFALGAMGAEAKRAVPLLIEQQEEDALVHIGAPAVPELIHALNNSATRWFALGVLGKLGPQANEAIPQLEHALYDNDKSVRFLAIRALARIGKEAAPQLQQALIISRTIFDDENVRLVALETLGNLGSEAKEAFTSLLIELEEETNPGLIATITRALPNFGTPAVEPLISELFDDKPHVRDAAVSALGNIGDKRAIEPLQMLLKTGEG